MSALFGQQPKSTPPPPRKKAGPPPPREKPKPAPVARLQENPYVAPPLKRVKKGEICYLKVRIVQPVVEMMGPSMAEVGCVMVEVLNGEDPSCPGRSDSVFESALITKQQVQKEIREAMERGAS